MKNPQRSDETLRALRGGFRFIREIQIFSPLRARRRRMVQSVEVQVVPQRGRIGQQRHARLIGRSVAFALVARMTARAQVFRHGLSAARTRQNVIQRQVLERPLDAAILTPVPVANKNLRAQTSRRAAPLADVYVFKQANHGWALKCKSHRPQHAIRIVFKRFGRSLPNHAKRTRQGHGAERLIRGVERQHFPL
jgi:hypothetical protein